MDENLKDKLKKYFPITNQGIIIDYVNERQLLDFKKRGEQGDMSMYTCRPVKIKSDEESLQSFTDLIERQNGSQFGLYDSNNKNNRILLGRISLFDYNPRNRSVELGYRMDEAFEGKGLMKKALMEVIKCLFWEADINKIYAQTASINKKSIGLLLSLGFLIDARLREHHEWNGNFYDDYIFSLLVKDFKKGLPTII